MHIGLLQDDSEVVKTLSGVAHRASRSSCSFYLTFPEVRESLSGVVHRAHRLLSRCEYYRIASAKRVAGVVLWRSPCSPVSICDCKLCGRRGTSCTFATFKMRVLSHCDWRGTLAILSAAFAVCSGCATLGSSEIEHLAPGGSQLENR